MARKNRQYGKSGFYHVIIRGNNKQNIFIDDQDHMIFLNRLAKFSSQLNITIFAYCLMSNHVHLMLGNTNTNLSLLMLKLNTSYSHLFNIKYERTGHLFQGRFLSKPIEKDSQILTVFRYILQNPEKANLGKYNEYKWNSYLANVNEFKKKRVHQNKVLHISDYFNNKSEMLSFLDSKNNDICMEYENKKIINDMHCLSILKKQYHISSPFSLQRMKTRELKYILLGIQSFGASINQISRITGLSRKQIQLLSG